MRGQPLAGVMLCLLLTMAPATDAQSASTWDRLQVLIGTWDSRGDTQLGPGEGSAAFTRELDGHVIVRRSFADYPKTGSRHDDLLVIYRDAPGAQPRAVYFDSEGHVIRYAVTAPTADSVVFESDGSDPGPAYRLSYTRTKNGLDGAFEIAAPGAGYKTYLSWTSTLR
jgi:hypothetical protein